MNKKILKSVRNLANLVDGKDVTKMEISVFRLDDDGKKEELKSTIDIKARDRIRKVYNSYKENSNNEL